MSSCLCYHYETCCVNARGEDIIAMQDRAIKITWKTIRKYCVGLREWAKDMGYELNKRNGLTLWDDWHVTFHRSVYRGKPCYYVQHSSIEYIWVSWEPAKIQSVRDGSYIMLQVNGTTLQGVWMHRDQQDRTYYISDTFSGKYQSIKEAKDRTLQWAKDGYWGEVIRKAVTGGPDE